MQEHPSLRKAWILNYCRIGIASLSVLYLLMGTLTATAALGLGGAKSDQKDVFPILMKQPLGVYALCLLASGLVGYVFWRLIQLWTDPSRHGMGPIGICFRIGYLASAMFHAGLAAYAFRMVWGGRPTQEPENTPILVGLLMRQPYGVDLVWLSALIFLIVGFVQFWRAFTERFRKQIPDEETNRRHPVLIRWTGRLGFSARGVVLVLIAWLFSRAAEHGNPKEAGGIDRVWDVLQSGPMGPVLLTTVAGCLAVYGVFLGVKAWGLQEDLAG